MLIWLALVAGGDLPVTTKPAPDPNKIVCKDLARTGSRLANDRVCMTRGQWDEKQRMVQKDITDMQANTTRCPTGQVC